MRVALTGHRPQRLGLPDDELDIKWARIGCWIFNQILDVSDVYCGMANGSDILIGLNTCIIKESYRSISEEFEKNRDLKLHCILPCKDYNSSINITTSSKMKLTNGLNYQMNSIKVVTM